MYLLRLVTLVALGGALSAPLAAQGIPRNAQRSGQATMAPRFMVANPFAFAPADSAAAVAIGSGMRDEMKGVVGRDYQVVEQQQMNDALTQYGYPKDAILSPALATTLAKNIQARFLVTSTLQKGQGGRYTATARVHGVNDDAGNVIATAQQQGESPAGVREAHRGIARSDGGVARRRQVLHRAAYQQARQGRRRRQQGDQGGPEPRSGPLLPGASGPGQEGSARLKW